MSVQDALLRFETARPGNPVFCHQEFLEKLESWRTQPIGKRASLLLQRLMIDSSRVHYKATRGDNQGWRRSRLGGNQGSHFYAWWAPRGSAPLARSGAFHEAPEGSIFLRDIRHHDDHSPLPPHAWDQHYLPVSAFELRQEDFGPAPWTASQQRFATARTAVRVLKGHPGSGKTTALLHAADITGAQRVLYVTYSPDLASLARLYFERYCDKNRYFHVVTYTTFLRELLQCSVEIRNEAELRKKFRGDLIPFTRSLGAWTDRQDALYDELHAHLVGGALPVAGGRFRACDHPRLADGAYRERRGRFLGPAAGSAADIASRLERAGSSLAHRYFPELDLSWQAATALAPKSASFSRINPAFLEFDCIAIDECQDLTALEAFVLVALGATIRDKRKHAVAFLAAGDEAQTVRPTDFEWGWMSDLLHHFLATPQEFRLTSNLRSPKQIAQVVNHVWDLYVEVEKRDRPSGTGYAEIDDESPDQVFYCSATAGEELNALLADLAAREGLALIAMDDSIPKAIPEKFHSSILSVNEAKGLDFHTVCLLDAGKLLDRIQSMGHSRLITADIESIRRRLAIDKLRVALSRPTERLIWLDIEPKAETVSRTLGFFNPHKETTGIALSIPSVVEKALAEEQLDVEERIQRCMQDARQYLTIRPEVAWTRAHQAVSLLGQQGSRNFVSDVELRKAAHRCVLEICFQLGMNGVKLGPDLGSPDLFNHAGAVASQAGEVALVSIIYRLREVQNAASDRDALTPLGYLMQEIIDKGSKLPPWFFTAIGPKVNHWLEVLEGGMRVQANVPMLSKLLPQFYAALSLPDAASRKQKLLSKAVESLIQAKEFRPALEALESMAERDYGREALCLKGMREYAQAAARYLQAGNPKEALACYREVPDFGAAFRLIQELKDHPAADSLRWLQRLQKVIDDRPANFTRVMTAAEKQLLEKLLEQALGVSRKKPATRQSAAADANVKRKVEQYIREHSSSRYCDGCLSELLRLPKAPVAKAAREASTGVGNVERLRAVCIRCGEKKTCTGISLF
ncbi:MAG: hypothetical protein IT165_32825 [Bryobacterales bacterium]|nr:hypothetical protein [Bryobacterales bacterium]